MDRHAAAASARPARPRAPPRRAAGRRPGPPSTSAAPGRSRRRSAGAPPDAAAREPGGVAARHDLALPSSVAVAAPNATVAVVGLVAVGEPLLQLHRVVDADREDAGRGGIERPGVAGLVRPERAADALHHVEARRPRGLVDDEDAAGHVGPQAHEAPTRPLRWAAAARGRVGLPLRARLLEEPLDAIAALDRLVVDEAQVRRVAQLEVARHLALQPGRGGAEPLERPLALLLLARGSRRTP